MQVFFVVEYGFVSLSPRDLRDGGSTLIDFFVFLPYVTYISPNHISFKCNHHC